VNTSAAREHEGQPEGAGRLGCAVLELLAEGELELPPLPGHVAELLALLGESEADMRRVAAVVARDPVLAAGALRQANSPLYAPVAPIHSLPEAVARLGGRALSALVTGIALRRGVFQGSGLAHGLVERLWAHAALAGSLARSVARERRGDQDGALLIGLVHDVGRPLALGLLVRAQRRLDPERGLAPAALRSAADALHEDLGAMLVGEWDLPAHLMVAAGCHHEPDAAEQHPHAAVLAHVADRLAHWVQSGGGRAPEPDLVQRLGGLGLGREALARILSPGGRACEGLFAA
jgi:HD-like signal output (HDOD) protein